MRLVVIKGGPSAEREISLRSGAAVARALRSRGHSVEEMDLRSDAIDDFAPLRRAAVVFVALHGTFGEDGKIQRLLERKGIPYTGSRPDASALTMDKAASKRRFLRLGLQTPAFGVVHAGGSACTAHYAELTARVLGYPVVVKPNEQGSSVGVSIHWSPESLEEGVQEAMAYGPRVLVERYIRGREITVGILSGRALPAIELHPARTFFDYTAKYHDAKTGYVINPEWLSRWQERVSNAALKVHRGLGCTGMTRVDMIVTDTGAIHLLEVNTIPGLTERSLFPMAAKAAGIEFPDLCLRLVKSALAAHRARARRA